MLRRSVGNHAGVLLVEESDSRLNTSIHMLFMRFDIAVVWINSSMEVVDVRLARKWQLMLAPTKPAKYVLELHTCQLPNFKAGDRIEIIHD